MENTERRIGPFRIPHLLGLVVAVVFLPWVVLTGKSERDARRAIEAHEPFSLPPFPFKFSRTMKYDSLGFMGQGTRAGFWEWSPASMNLTPKGRPYFSESPAEIASLVNAGRREVKKIEGFKDEGDRRTVRFLYHWPEVSPPAAMLMSTPPQPGREYAGTAVLVRQGGEWRLEKLDTPDFDRPLALLLDTGAGIRR